MFMEVLFALLWSTSPALADDTQDERSRAQAILVKKGGFRDIKFGRPASDYPQLTPVECGTADPSNWSCYRNAGERLTLFGHPIPHPVYKAADGMVIGVWVEDNCSRDTTNKKYRCEDYNSGLRDGRAIVEAFCSSLGLNPHHEDHGDGLRSTICSALSSKDKADTITFVAEFRHNTEDDYFNYHFKLRRGDYEDLWFSGRRADKAAAAKKDLSDF